MPVPFDTFAQLEIRLGKIIEVDDMPQAKKPLYRLKVDFGPEGTKQCVAGVKSNYPKEQLLGKLIVAAVNLEPRPIAGVTSECMLLASSTQEDLSLLVPDKDMPPGSRVS